MNYCKCNCGKQVKKNWATGHHRFGATFQLSEEAKDKIRQSQLGKNNSMYGKLPYNKGKKLSRETRQKIKVARAKQIITNTHKKSISEGLLKAYKNGTKGTALMFAEKNPRWISNRSLLKRSNTHIGSAYLEWRFNVNKRDNFKCKISNEDCSGKIETHHILRWFDFPKLRYEINNGITLCHFHHPRKKSEEKKLSLYFSDLISQS